MADVLMEHLPPSGWTDVLRQADLDRFREWVEYRFEQTDARFDLMEARFDAKLEGMRAEMLGELHDEIGGLHGEIGDLRDGFRSELHQEIGGLRKELNDQTRSLFLGISGLMLTICIVVFTAAKLL